MMYSKSVGNRECRRCAEKWRINRAIWRSERRKLGETKTRKDLTGTTACNAEDSVDGNDLDTEPGLEEGGSLLDGLGSSGHDDGEWRVKGVKEKTKEREKKKKNGSENGQLKLYTKCGE